jgi:hypothetical protein
MVLQALNVICPRKTNAIAESLENQFTHSMTCVTKAMNGGWRLEFIELKLCSKP